MNKPGILVTSAAGRTGSATVLELLKKGFPVRAFVRKRDARAEALEKAGAELAIGDLFDFRDIRKAESFENTARRYLADPSLIDPRLANGGKLAAMAFMVRMLLARVPNLDRWERDRGHAMLNAPILAADNKEWLASAKQQELNLLPV